MRLVFDKEIEFLHKELGINIPSKSAWMDRMNVKVMDNEGKWHIIYKIKAENMKLKLIKDNTNKINNCNLKTWNDLVNENKDRLTTIEEESIKIIHNYIEKHNNYTIVIPVSGGKDSAIVYDLVTRCIEKHNLHNEVKIIFSNTSNENHITYKHIKENYPMAQTLSPKVGFYQLIKQYGTVPSRFNRYCCSLLKETVTIEQLKDHNNLLFFMGMRKEESQKRSQYEIEWRNIRWTNETWQGVLPILNYTEFDIWLLMLKNEIKINDNYIGAGRVGCMFCPYRSDYELIIAKEFYPKYYERWTNVLTSDFIDNRKAPSINASLEEYINGAWKAGMVRDEATEEIIKEFAEYTNLDYDIAKKYFDKTCSDCGKTLKKNDIALSMKYFGRNIDKYFCIKCLSKKLNKTVKELKEKIKEFISDGCSLF